MVKIEECEKCEIKFYDIGNLKAKVRVKRHMKTLHTIPCEKCEKTFVSLSHKDSMNISHIILNAHIAIEFVKGIAPVASVLKQKK